MKTMELSAHKLNTYMKLNKLESELTCALQTYLDYQKIHLKQLERIKQVASRLKDLKSGNEDWFKQARKVTKELTNISMFSVPNDFNGRVFDKFQKLMEEDNE